MIPTTEMPTVNELRMMLRKTFTNIRVNKDNFVLLLGDLTFIHRELSFLGERNIYDDEYRRHELIARGFTPPENLV